MLEVDCEGGGVQSAMQTGSFVQIAPFTGGSESYAFQGWIRWQQLD